MIDKALKTWYQPEHQIPDTEQINQAILQLQSEAGELASLWAKELYKPGHIMTRENVLDELGDVWYYVRILCHLSDITIKELTDFNEAKLRGGHGWKNSHKKIKARMKRTELPY